ncbi:hypothetical protein BCR44DRAFT_42003 [Catenaria anguillulae PL171]|uniref:Uncharacterized protein n=1 Tax=Catenaria anguillulae PL171 TaxID=765915 RepID=A0A1Y2I0P5_9FUNG|nr:hypothetical protein BCR44DRAFT_42003 [Catenaria anguillulae PL171]
MYVSKLSSRCRQSLYVALSRVRTSTGLTTKELLTEEVLMRFKPKDKTLEGQADLEQHARETTTWLRKLELLVRTAFDAKWWQHRMRFHLNTGATRTIRAAFIEADNKRGLTQEKNPARTALLSAIKKGGRIGNVRVFHVRVTCTANTRATMQTG